MKVLETPLPGVLLIEPEIFRDDRGFFVETYSTRQFEQLVILPGVRSGQSRPLAAGSPARHPLSGASRTTGQACALYRGGRCLHNGRPLRRLSDPWSLVWPGANGRQHAAALIPAGCGHAYLVLTEGAEVQYKTTGFVLLPPRAQYAGMTRTWPSTGPSPTQSSPPGPAAPTLKEYLQSPVFR